MCAVGDWKAVRVNLNPGPKAKDQKPGAVELYNLATDPGETRNVAAQHPVIVAQLCDIMKKQHKKSDLFPMPSARRRRKTAVIFRGRWSPAFRRFSGNVCHGSRETA